MLSHSVDFADLYFQLSHEEAWALNKAAEAAIQTGEDFKEGPRAFAEKRKPNWKGR